MGYSFDELVERLRDVASSREERIYYLEHLVQERKEALEDEYTQGYAYGFDMGYGEGVADTEDEYDLS